jgi:hypothetical protein
LGALVLILARVVIEAGSVEAPLQVATVGVSLAAVVEQAEPVVANFPFEFAVIVGLAPGVEGAEPTVTELEVLAVKVRVAREVALAASKEADLVVCTLVVFKTVSAVTLPVPADILAEALVVVGTDGVEAEPVEAGLPGAAVNVIGAFRKEAEAKTALLALIAVAVHLAVALFCADTLDADLIDPAFVVVLAVLCERGGRHEQSQRERESSQDVVR